MVIDNRVLLVYLSLLGCVATFTTGINREGRKKKQIFWREYKSSKKENVASQFSRLQER